MRLTKHWRLLVGTGLAAASSIAVGQSEDAIAECSRIAEADERIVCLEDAIRGLSGDEPAAPVDAMTRPIAEPPAAPAAEQAPPAAMPKVEDAEVVVSEPAPAAPREPAEPAPAAAAEAPAEPVEAAADELGAEQVAARSGNREPPERIQARVAAFDFVRRDKLVVTLDNGQVWRQTDSDRPSHYRSLRRLDTFEVEMWETGLGGYRMLIKPTNKMVRVQRLK